MTPITYLQVSFRGGEGVVIMGTFDAANTLAANRFGMSPILLRETQ